MRGPDRPDRPDRPSNEMCGVWTVTRVEADRRHWSPVWLVDCEPGTSPVRPVSQSLLTSPHMWRVPPSHRGHQWPAVRRREEGGSVQPQQSDYYYTGLAVWPSMAQPPVQTITTTTTTTTRPVLGSHSDWQYNGNNQWAREGHSYSNIPSSLYFNILSVGGPLLTF